MNFEVGNVVDYRGTIIVLTEIKMLTNTGGESYEYVNYKEYKGRWRGGFRVQGYEDTQACGCYYDSAFRCYYSDRPDEDCEDCLGTGEEKIYIEGLNDCTLVAKSVTDFKIIKLERKIKESQEKLDKLKREV